MSNTETFVRANSIFANLKPEHMAFVVANTSETVFPAGHVIFREGEPAAKLYLIEQGRVELRSKATTAAPLVIARLGLGEALGWSWLFPPHLWTLDAVTLEETRAVVINGAELLRLAELHPDFGYELMKRVSRLVIQRLQGTRKQLVESELNSAMEG
jgi:CRP-like cAMP-binding protein